MAEIPLNVYISHTPLNQLKLFFENNHYSKIVVLVDENTQQLCYPKIQHLIPAHGTLCIPTGEANKTLVVCEKIWQLLSDIHADRDSLLVNLGGGMLCDIGGFAAGCYKRGISYLNIPTTLLAMADASVGSKTGIDFNGFKNQIGLFNPARAVYIATSFLETLPERELLSGFAEVIKHYLIADAVAFKKLITDKLLLRQLHWQSIVQKNVAIKTKLVEQDPQENNVRKALNFGHTVGHAVETHFLKQNNPVLHGEAVAIGMISESYISQQHNTVSQSELAAITHLIMQYFCLPQIPENHFNEILQWMQQDKKKSAGENRFTLLNGIGNFLINQQVNTEVIIASLQYYNKVVYEQQR